jgi:FKBP12-rapamycin complex-associated protein
LFVAVSLWILAGNLANKCHAYAKALHYKEIEFHSNQAACLESLIAINNQLEQPEAAVGILKHAQQLQLKQQQQVRSCVG